MYTITQTPHPIVQWNHHRNERRYTRIRRLGLCFRWLGAIGEFVFAKLMMCYYRWTLGGQSVVSYLFANITTPKHQTIQHTNKYRLEPNSQFRLAIGSYIEQYNNTVQVLKTRISLPHPTSEYSTVQIYSACEIEHPYPCTKILWSPEGKQQQHHQQGGNYGGRDLLATTGDYLRIWSVSEDESRGDGRLSHKREVLLNNVSYR